MFAGERNGQRPRAAEKREVWAGKRGLNLEPGQLLLTLMEKPWWSVLSGLQAERDARARVSVPRARTQFVGVT